MAGNDSEMFTTRSFNVTPETTEQHLIACSAIRNNTKRLCSTFSTIDAILQTRSIARGLFATAELLVCYYCPNWMQTNATHGVQRSGSDVVPQSLALQQHHVLVSRVCGRAPWRWSAARATHESSTVPAARYE